MLHLARLELTFFCDLPAPNNQDYSAPRRPVGALRRPVGTFHLWTDYDCFILVIFQVVEFFNMVASPLLQPYSTWIGNP
jgi:hypothetical protein